jgi:phenylpropionate dioxygenase-like ring-hydroxylating dioxygenase large terminal subunit
MAEKGKFLTDRYSAYLHPASPEMEDTELTRVGRGTPGGEYLRRFWHPFLLTEELKDVPIAVRLLGEDLVAFRDGSGRIGLLERYCSHRGTSLEFGQISQCGLRCCYHSWLFDVDGRILETPGEPADSTLKDRLFHGAYPVHEYRGLVFTYMGPPDKKPEFPIYDTYDVPGYDLLPGRNTMWPCNWIQVKENITDPVHLSFLHTHVSGAQFTEAFGVIPEIEWVESPLGIATVSRRRVDDHAWIRISDLMLPNVHQFASTSTGADEEMRGMRPDTTMWAVPIDDTHTMNISFVRVQHGRTLSETELEELKQGLYQDGNRTYDERQRHPGDYEAMVHRPIALHGMEHLATTDRGVIMFRKMLREGIRAVQNGQDPKGLCRDAGPLTTYSQETILKIPPESTPEADRRMLYDLSKKVLDGAYMKTPPAVRIGKGESVSFRD